MRRRTGCQSCRDRHIKCVKRPEFVKCDKCLETDRECIQVSLHRFRPVKSVPQKGRGGKALSKRNLTFDSFQVWVDVPNKVEFNSPSNATSDEPEIEIVRSAIPTPRRKSSIRNVDFRDDSGFVYPNPFSWDSTRYDAPSVLSPSIQRAQSAEPTPVIRSPQTIHSELNLPDQLVVSPPQTRVGDEIARQSALISSPAQTTPRTEHTRFLSHASPTANGISSSHSSMRPGLLSITPMDTTSPALSMTPSWPFQNRREAKLLYHYVKNIAPWIDVCDRYSYFGREIPRRVAYHPVISSAIFALASRHISLLSENEQDDSPRYVDECLQIVLNILEDPLGHSDENLLAAVILLRSHEELSDHDERCHALGTTRLLNSISAGAGDGGLREAASWICLRQHIYLSLTGQELISLNLSNYRHSSIFTDQSDESWANRIVYIFANILNYVFQADDLNTGYLDPSRWIELEGEVEAWKVNKPWYFSTLWSDDSNQYGPHGWPELQTSEPAHTVGLQYYYLSKIVLAIYDPKLSKLGFASFKVRKNSEMQVQENLRMAVGLAVSNPDVTNAMFQGSHILHVCGSYLHDPQDRQAAVAFLRGMQKSMGWNTVPIIQNLLDQWRA